MSDYISHDLNRLVEEALAALEAGGTSDAPLVDGRIVAVHASPETATSERMAMGISALPPGYSTPPHNHDAEEFALVVHGSGSITIEDEVIPVQAGSVVVTPPGTTHVTTAADDGPLVVYWTYGPAGSERRWLSR